jgi:hypothetical protein
MEAQGLDAEHVGHTWLRSCAVEDSRLVELPLEFPVED